MSHIGIIVWGASTSAIKTSIALTLLRLLRSRPWRLFLWVMIILQGAFFVGNTTWLLLRCRPLNQVWVFPPNPGACASEPNVRMASNITSAFNIATDIILSLIPLTFIVKLQRPVLEKILLALLMAIGLFASITSILKTVVVQHFGSPSEPDQMAVNVALVTWTCAEQFLGVAAACLPSFKRPLQRFLKTLGIDVTSHNGYGVHSRGADALRSRTMPAGTKQGTVLSGRFDGTMGTPRKTESEEDIYHLKTFDSRPVKVTEKLADAASAASSMDNSHMSNGAPDTPSVPPGRQGRNEYV